MGRYIHDWREAYRVDRQGNIWSTMLRDTERQLKPWLQEGYPVVCLYVRGRKWMVPVHVLVALSYLGQKPSPKHVVRHLDGNKENSTPENLAWGTQKQNLEDRQRHGRTSSGVAHAVRIRRGLPEYKSAPGAVAMQYVSEALFFFRKVEGCP